MFAAARSSVSHRAFHVILSRAASGSSVKPFYYQDIYEVEAPLGTPFKKLTCKALYTDFHLPA